LTKGDFVTSVRLSHVAEFQFRYNNRENADIFGTAINIAVRTAAQRMIADPLRRQGIDSFQIRENGQPLITVGRGEAEDFNRPDLPDETIVEASHRAAFSIISLAFKEATL
jgi:hypothetical protein